MPFRTPVKVRFSDVDNAGIVYYPRFFHFFHIAFEELFSERFGVPYPEVLSKEKIGFPAVHAEIDFKSPLRYGDVADVEISVEKVGTKSVTCRYRVLRQPEQGAGGAPRGRPKGARRATEAGSTLSAEGRVVVATVEMDGFRPVAIPDRYRRFFEAERAPISTPASSPRGPRSGRPRRR